MFFPQIIHACDVLVSVKQAATENRFVSVFLQTAGAEKAWKKKKTVKKEVNIVLSCADCFNTVKTPPSLIVNAILHHVNRH